MNELPIFNESKPKTQSPRETLREVRTLKIGALKVPVTVEEYALLENRLSAHVTKHGVAFGFVSGLVRDV